MWLTLATKTYRVQVGGVGAYLAQVDRLLGAGQALFPTFVPSPGGAGVVGPGTPAAPQVSQLGSGAEAAGNDYRRSWDAVTGLDEQTKAVAAQGAVKGESGRAGATGVRTTAAAAAAALAPASDTPAGVKMLVSRMDDRLEAMQRQIASTKAQNQLLATRLRQVVMAYRAVAPAAVSAALPRIGAGAGVGELSGLGPAGGATQAGLFRLAPVTRRLDAMGRSGSPLGRLSADSTRREVAAAIVHEALRRGYSPRQTVAILSTALQESDLRPKAMSANGQWESIFQQDSSYRSRGNPNAVIEQFFDRLGARGGPGSPDIWKSIFWLQQRPGELSAELAYEHGRRAYLDEIQSKLGPAAAIFQDVTNP